MKKNFILLMTLVLLSISSVVFSSNEPEGVSISKEGSNYIVEFRIPEYIKEFITAEGNEYINLLIPGYGVTSEVGMPQLPQITFNLAIGREEENLSIQVLESSNTVQLLENKIYPFQEPWERTQLQRPFTINDDYYNSTGNEDQPMLSFSEPFILAGIKGSRISIFPFKYNPIENKLTIVTYAKFRINLQQEFSDLIPRSIHYTQFFNTIFVNYEPGIVSRGVKYLIITAPEYEATINNFAAFKTSVGYEVTVVTTAVTGTTTTSIKSYIQQLYDNVATRPEFILLVGDVDKIPSWTGEGAGNPKTDLTYVRLDGTDHYADASIGRFSVASVAQLNNAISKSIYMETNIGALDKKSIFMSSTDNYTITEGSHNYVIDNYFDPAGYTCLKLYTVTYGATTTQLINALNDNQQFAIYSGHGATTYWADGPQLNQTQVMALTNTYYPFVYSFACLTGEFDYPECFGETWLRYEHGASAFYGSSVTSYWDEDDILEKRVFQSMFVDDITLITPMMDQGKIYLVNYYGSMTSTMKRYLEMYNLMGDPSLPVKKQIPYDNTPPDPVVDLAVVDTTSNSITLSWTVPNDTTFGGVTEYDIRYSTTAILDTNDFNNATQVPFPNSPDTTGAIETFMIQGLDFNTDYYFAIRCADVWQNWSDLSNVPAVCTWEAPVISVNPNSLSLTINPQLVSKDTFYISNISGGNSTLDFELSMENNTFPGNDNVHLRAFQNNKPDNNGTKDSPINHGGVSFDGSGGPDDFGYEWIDSNDPNGPVYEWNDISSTGTQVTTWIPTGTYNALDEGYAGPIALGFDFSFYGVDHSNIYISSNGLLTFSAITSNIFSNVAIPNSALPNDIIAPFWDDLDGGSQGSVYYQQDGNKFTIQFTNWQHYPGTGSLTFQIVLYSSGKIMIYYNSLTEVTDCTVGIENGDGTIGLQVAYNSAYVENGLALKIAAEPDWLSSSVLSGCIYNGNSVAVELIFNSEDYPYGVYSMDVVINSNDPVNSTIIVPVSMEIVPVPVEFVSFKANAGTDGINLEWTTATETNNSGFEIQRREGNENQWIDVAFVQGKGTTTELSQYSYMDRYDNIITKTNLLYRLKQIDLDGSISYSNSIEVSGEIIPQEYALEQNYPNPFNPETKIKFSLPETSEVQLLVYNILGEVVSELINAQKDPGFYHITWNAANISSGIYFYVLSAKSKESARDFREVKKMILIK